MSRSRRFRQPRPRWHLHVPAAFLATLVMVQTAVAGPWPKSSDLPLRPMNIATIEERTSGLVGVPSEFRFVAFGDQRALADGEWQALMRGIHHLSQRDPGLLFMIDTGDIVGDGNHSDQFRMLADTLEPLTGLPYWIAFGNHELDNNRGTRARGQAAVFLSELDRELSTKRLYYTKDVGSVRFVFLDSNDLVYGEDGNTELTTPAPGSRSEAQMAWLTDLLEKDDRGPDAITVVSMHHPLIQSSSKHRNEAKRLWSYAYKGRSLPEILAGGGVDIILCGHTHTYERFRIARENGDVMSLINLSGRPRNSFLWFGARSRRAKDLRDKETKWLAKKGWEDLEGWTITQEDAMTKNEANQFGLFSVKTDGSVSLEMYYLDKDSPDGFRLDPEVELP